MTNPLIEKAAPRKQEIEKLKSSGLTYQEIGKRLGISRQRVQQLTRPNTKERHIIQAIGYCQECGRHIDSKGHIHHSESGLLYLCLSCHMHRHKHELPRNELIRLYAREHPKLRLRELAAIFGITTTRIWVILNKK